MRWIHLAVNALFALATLVFAIQNFQIVTMSFLGLSARVPLALLVVVVYLLGMSTGGSLWALLRAGPWKEQGARRRNGYLISHIEVIFFDNYHMIYATTRPHSEAG
jgi:putative membrane protein